MHSGDDYFTRLEELINGAKHEIHLQTYVFDSDETGTRIANALIKAYDKVAVFAGRILMSKMNWTAETAAEIEVSDHPNSDVMGVMKMERGATAGPCRAKPAQQAQKRMTQP